jgi:hypothetical protein
MAVEEFLDPAFHTIQIGFSLELLADPAMAVDHIGNRES